MTRTSFASYSALAPEWRLFVITGFCGGLTTFSTFSAEIVVHEGDRHHGRPVWEWLLEQGSKLGIRGGSAFRAMAGFGRHHVLRENHFFELAGTLTVEVEFIVTDEESRQLLELLHQERIRLFYAHTPARFGVIDPDTGDPSPVVYDE